jgi:hypothetical protein
MASSWKQANFPDVPYQTSVMAGRIEIGDAGMRIVGALWMFAGLLFMIAAAGVATTMPWAFRLTWICIALSLAMCVTGWPRASIGLWLNLALAAVMVAMVMR